MSQVNTIILAVAMASAMTACSTTPKTELEKSISNQSGQERVISRIDEMDSRPKWLQEQTPFRFEDGKVYSIGITSIPADGNLSAAYRIAENNGKSSISHAIEQRLSFVFQNAEEGTTLGASQAQFLGAEASKLTTNSLRLAKRYWEKVAAVQNEQVSVQYRVFVLVEMDEPAFKAAITDAIRKNQGKQGISAEFAKKVDQHWDSFVGTDKANPEPRTPSSGNDTEK